MRAGLLLPPPVLLQSRHAVVPPDLHVSSKIFSPSSNSFPTTSQDHLRQGEFISCKHFGSCGSLTTPGVRAAECRQAEAPRALLIT